MKFFEEKNEMIVPLGVGIRLLFGFNELTLCCLEKDDTAFVKHTRRGEIITAFTIKTEGDISAFYNEEVKLEYNEYAAEKCQEGDILEITLLNFPEWSPDGYKRPYTSNEYVKKVIVKILKL